MCELCTRIKKKHPDYNFCPYCGEDTNQKEYIQDVCTHMCNGKDVRTIIRTPGGYYKYCPICGKKDYDI